MALPEEVQNLDARISYLARELMPSLSKRISPQLAAAVRGLSVSWESFKAGVQREGLTDDRRQILVLFEAQRDALTSEIRRSSKTGEPSLAMQDLMGQRSPGLLTYSLVAVVGGLLLGAAMSHVGRGRA